MNKQSKKPLGRKCYGSIPHLPNSRLGSGDWSISEGQARIATEKRRDENDLIIVQEKLDGSNVGVAIKDGKVIPLVRAGYVANTSPYGMHHEFYKWVLNNEDRFLSCLKEGERICGEWLIQAHGTIYELPHEPFVAFDIFTPNNDRLIYSDFTQRSIDFVIPYLVHIGEPINVENAMPIAGVFGHHGALDPIEGLMYRVERNGKVDFLCKYVKPEKVDGQYLNDTIMNKWRGH
jgi:hypothetical protein